MIFNLPTYITSGINGEELVTLLIIKNKFYEDCKDRRETLISLFNKGLVEKIKGNKKDAEYLKARLSPKGKHLMRDLQIPGITDEVKEIAAELKEMYISKGLEDRLGNMKQVVRLMAWFLQITECNTIAITSAVDRYLTITDPKFVSTLENLIWKPVNMYSPLPKLEESKLIKEINKV